MFHHKKQIVSFHCSDASRRSKESTSYRWTTNNTLVFETRSNWRYPKALSLKVSSLSEYTGDPDEHESHHDQSEMGCGFVDLCPIWKKQMMNQELKDSSIDSKTKIYLFDSAEEFDQHGQAVESFAPREDVRIDVSTQLTLPLLGYFMPLCWCYFVYKYKGFGTSSLC